MRASNRTAVRLSAFALVLAGTFGTAYAFGERLPGHDHSTPSKSHDHPTGDDVELPIEPGFEMNGFQLVAEEMHHTGAAFYLLGPDGERVTEFAVAHGALLHAVVIRPDLSDFHHVHPSIEDNGSWTVPVDGHGKWHVVFESTPIIDGQPVEQAIVVSANLDDEEVVDTVALPAADDNVEIDGLVVSRDGFVFRVTNADGGAASGLEPYLSQVAHLVVLRQGDLAFTHLHPLESPPATFDFGDGLSEPGTYRLFLQFGHAGDVVTVPFTVVLP